MERGDLLEESFAFYAGLRFGEPAGASVVLCGALPCGAVLHCTLGSQTRDPVL